jgi:hypothetical protein
MTSTLFPLPPAGAWANIQGKPFVTVTPNGPADGGDFGPNSGDNASGFNALFAALAGSGNAQIAKGIFNQITASIQTQSAIAGLVLGGAGASSTTTGGSIIEPSSLASIHNLMNLGGLLAVHFVIRDLAFFDNGVAMVASASTTASGTNNAGQTTLNVASASGFLAGDLIKIGSGTTIETQTIASISGNAFTLCNSLAYAHSSNDSITQIPILVNLEQAEGTRRSTIQDVHFHVARAANQYALNYSGNDDSDLIDVTTDSAINNRILWNSPGGGVRTFGGIYGGGIDLSFQVARFFGTTFGDYIGITNNQSKDNRILNLYGCYNNPISSAASLFVNNSQYSVRVNIYGGHLDASAGQPTTSIFSLPPSGKRWIVDYFGGEINVGSNSVTFFASGDTSSILKIHAYPTLLGTGTLTLPTGAQLTELADDSLNEQIGGALTSYNAQATAGFGLMVPVTSVDFNTGQTAAQTLATFTTPASQKTEYELSVTLNVSAFTSNTSATLTVSYTDQNGVARTLNIPVFNIAGSIGLIASLVTGTGDYPSVIVPLKCNAAANTITVAIGGTFAFTYRCGIRLQRKM